MTDETFSTPGGIIYLRNLAMINSGVVPPEGVVALATEVERLEGLLSRVAYSATQYGSRVYRLTDDFEALAGYLTQEQIDQADERPSDADSRVAVERDVLKAENQRLRDVLRDCSYEDDRGVRIINVSQVEGALRPVVASSDSPTHNDIDAHRADEGLPPLYTDERRR